MFFSLDTKNKTDNLSLSAKIEEIVAKENDAEIILSRISRELSNAKLSEIELKKALTPLKKLGMDFEDHIDNEIDKANEVALIFTKLCEYLRACDHNILTQEDINMLSKIVLSFQSQNNSQSSLQRFVGKEKHLVHRIYDENLFGAKSRATFLKSIARAL